MLHFPAFLIPKAAGNFAPSSPVLMTPSLLTMLKPSCPTLAVAKLQAVMTEAKKSAKNKGKGPVNGVPAAEKKAQREKAAAKEAAKKAQEAALAGRA